MFRILKMLCLLTYALSKPVYSVSFFEPYFGFAGAAWDQQLSNISGTVNGQVFTAPNAKITGDIGGPILGLRVYEKYLDQFMIGADVAFGFSNGGLYLDETSSLGNYDATTVSPGIIIGWDLPTWFLPRVWAGFYPIDRLSLTPENSDRNPDIYLGQSIKFGLSFDWWIQVGLEFASHTYDTLNDRDLPAAGTYSGISMTQEKVNYDEVILTLSYPFELK